MLLELRDRLGSVLVMNTYASTRTPGTNVLLQIINQNVSRLGPELLIRAMIGHDDLRFRTEVLQTPCLLAIKGSIASPRDCTGRENDWILVAKKVPEFLTVFGPIEFGPPSGSAEIDQTPELFEAEVADGFVPEFASSNLLDGRVEVDEDAVHVAVDLIRCQRDILILNRLFDSLVTHDRKLFIRKSN